MRRWVSVLIAIEDMHILDAWIQRLQDVTEIKILPSHYISILIADARRERGQGELFDTIAGLDRRALALAREQYAARRVPGHQPSICVDRPKESAYTVGQRIKRRLQTRRAQASRSRPELQSSQPASHKPRLAVVYPEPAKPDDVLMAMITKLTATDRFTTIE